MTISSANSLIYGSSWDQSSEIWSDEISQSSPTVSIAGGITTIKFTLLTSSLPSYYSGEDEEESGVFINITDTSGLWGDIEKALGQGTKIGYEVYFDDVAKVTFNEQTQSGSDVGAITFGGFNNIDHDSHAGADGFVQALPWSSANDDQLQGDVFFDFEESSGSDIGEENYLPIFFNGAILHEIGHALGLQHPNGLTGEENTVKYTMMVVGDTSAYQHPDLDYDSVDSANKYALGGLGLYDIAAIQKIYGADYSTRSGNTTYKIGQGFGADAGTTFFTTLWDGNGTDTIDATGYTKAAQIDLRQGHFSSIGVDGSITGDAIAFDSGGVDKGNVAIAYNAIIENAIGTNYDDSLIGNAWNNKLEGMAGNDRLFGDGVVYDGDYGYGAGQGEDDPNNPGASADSDDSGDDHLLGGSGNDTLFGGAGTDTLEGGTDDDVLRGGAGNDTYVYNFGDGDDVVEEASFTTEIIKLGAGVYAGGLDVQTVGDNIVIGFSDGGSLTIAGGALLDTDMRITTVDVTGSLNGKGGLLIGNDNGEYMGGYNGTSYAGQYYYDPVVAFGKGGNDYIGGQRSTDFLDGGAGNDVIYAWAGNDVAYGRSGSDSIYIRSYASGEETHVYAGDDNDIVYLGSSSSFYSTHNIDLGSGDDVFSAVAATKETFYVDDPSGNDTYLTLGGLYTEIHDQLGNDIYTVNNYGDNLVIKDDNGADKLDYSSTENISDFISATPIGADLKLVTVRNNSIIITDYFSGTSNKIEQVKFKNTDFFDIDFLVNSANVIFGTTGNDSSLNGNASNNTVLAFSGNDTVYGQAGNDEIYGAEGDDILVGGIGSDMLDGGDGTDTASYVSAAAGIIVSLASGSASNDGDSGSDTLIAIENIVGSAYADGITGNSGDNIFSGGAGDDVIDGGNGKDTANYSGDGAGITADLVNGLVTDGSSDTDTLTSIENITGSAYADSITGDANANILTGGAGADTLSGGDQHDTLYGDDGDDTLYGGEGNDLLYGGAGVDTIHAGGGYDEAWGGDGNDIINGDAQTDILHGDGGDDTIDGGGSGDTVDGGIGNDTLTGGDGDDTLSGGDGSDTLQGGAHNDTLTGGAGDDTINGGQGNDSIDGGDGTDMLSFAGAVNAVTANLTTGVATGDGTDTLSNFENITGSANYDTLTGNAAVNIIYGGNGTDFIYGEGANDALYGEDGHDQLYGGDGDDTLYGADGNDTFWGNAGNDTIYMGGGYDIAYGGTGNDSIWGDAQADTLYGDEDNDTLYGGGSSDDLFGGAGDDILIGENGGDGLWGGAGADTLTGGVDADIFGFLSADGSAVDTITDFSVNQGDKLDLSDLLEAFDPLVDAITDFVQITTSGPNSILAVDVDGGGNSFVNIATLTGVTGLTDEAALLSSGTLIAA